jgi:hypothetical protein
MRELHGYHGEHRRHAHDAAAPADTHGRHASDRAHDAPKHASHDAPRFKILRDPEARKAEHLRYQQKVEAAEAEYAARHAKPKPGEQTRAPEDLKPQEARPEHASPESGDKPATGIAKRRLDKSSQAPDVAAAEKPRFKEKAVSFWAAASGWSITTAADYLHFIPHGLAGEIAGAIGVAALGILWRQGERTENKNGNRPKD